MEEPSLLAPIQKIVHYSTEELMQRIRKVTMLQDASVCVYEKASIEIKPLHPSQMAPPQRYVQVKQIKLLQELHFALQEKGFNLFALNGYLHLWFEGQSDPVGIIPPVLEHSIEQDGSSHWIICDGMHRCFLARAFFILPQVVLISNIPYPYYAYPNPGGWADVELLYEETQGVLKKFHRIRANKKLYRNFVPQFGNLSVPRGKV
ncbi:MAG: hypothetical protein AABZ60_06345 [Planctomycetota bacterium]